MPLVQETNAGFRHLHKTITQADFGAITSSHMYDKQLGSDGTGNQTFTLPKDFSVGSNTLMVFVNGQKAELKVPATAPNEYREVNARTITFGAALSGTDVVEFIVAGTWDPSGAPGGGGSGTLNSVLVSDDITLMSLDRAVCIATKAILVNLPALPVAGEVCEIVDALGHASQYNITIGRNGKPIQGLTENLIIDTDGEVIFLVFVDETYGWKFTLTGNTIEQVSGFRQYHSATADPDQTVFNLPFSVDQVTKNISIHADGLQMTQDLAYTITSSTQITFTEGFLGGELVEFESFLASSLGQLYSLEQALLFKQTYTETAAVDQTDVVIPFDVDLARKNLVVYVDGVRQYTDEAFTLDSSTRLIFTEAFEGGEKILVESFNTGSLDDLVFNNYQHEAEALQDQTLIDLPFDYVVGAKNLAVTINGVRQLPSAFTEIDSNTIQLTGSMNAGDDIFVESVPMGAFGVIPLAQDSNKLGGVEPSGYRKIITTDTDFFVSSSGNDADDGSETSPWATVTKAMTYLADWWIVPSASIRIILIDGAHSFTEQVDVNHPCGDRITITGQNRYDTTMSSVVSQSGSAGNYTITVQLADASNAQVGNYAIIRNSDIEDPSVPNANFENPEYIQGCHEITGVNLGSNQITVLSKNNFVPTGSVTADVVILPTIITCAGHGFSAIRSMIALHDMVLIGPGFGVSTYRALMSYQHSAINCNDGIACAEFYTGFHASTNSHIYSNKAVVARCDNGFYATRNSTTHVSNSVAVGCGLAYQASIGGIVYSNSSMALDCSHSGFYASLYSHLYCSSSRALDCVDNGFYAIQASSIYANSTVAIRCDYGFYAVRLSLFTIKLSKAENCTYGFYATQGSFIQLSGATVYGNTTDYSPALATWGNSDSYII